MIYLETEIKKPLRVPKQEQATRIGMTQAITPKYCSAKLYNSYKAYI